MKASRKSLSPRLIWQIFGPGDGATVDEVHDWGFGEKPFNELDEFTHLLIC